MSAMILVVILCLSFFLNLPSVRDALVASSLVLLATGTLAVLFVGSFGVAHGAHGVKCSWGRQACHIFLRVCGQSSLLSIGEYKV